MSLIILLIFIFTLTKASSSAHLPPSYSPAQSPSNILAPESDNSATDFIRTRCGSTLYPSLCFTSLARFATYIRNDPVRLARVATKAAYFQIHSASRHVSSHLNSSSPPPAGREAAALRDCVGSLGSAADQTWRSALEIAKLGRPTAAAVGPEVAWRVSNAQTWMSAALTNEETCTDGFDGVEQDPVKADVFARVGIVKQYTSNSLALVNCLVNGG